MGALCDNGFSHPVPIPSYQAHIVALCIIIAYHAIVRYGLDAGAIFVFRGSKKGARQWTSHTLQMSTYARTHNVRITNRQ